MQEKNTVNGYYIGQRIKKYRKSKGLKLREFAKLIGIAQGTLSDIENNKYIPSGDTLSKIVRETDINPSWLLIGQGGMVIGEIEEAEQLRQELAHLKEELKKIDHEDEKDAAHLQALENRIRELELKNAELVGQIKLLKELMGNTPQIKGV